MIYRECQRFTRLTLTVLFGSLILFASCGQSLESHLQRGEEFLKQRRYDAALMQFRAAADIDSTSADAQWGLARTYENQEKFLETIEALRRVVDLAPTNLEAKAKLANYYLLFNPPQIQEAERLLDEILKQDKKYIEAYILRASIFSVKGNPEHEIVQVLRQAIALDKKRTESYLALSRFYMKVNNAVDAEATIKEGIAANPKNSLGYIEYGRFLVYSGRSEEAETQFAKAVSVEPKNIDAGLAIASYFISTQQNEKAEKRYQALVKLQENSAESRMDLGKFYSLIGRDKDAVKTYESILNEASDYALARYALTEIYLSRREYDKVTAEIEKLLSTNDQDAEALMLRARLKLAQGNPEDSIEDIENVLKKQPSFQEALYNMAQARLAMGQIDQARAYIGDLEKYHPNYRKVSFLKIQAFFASNEAEKARDEAGLLIQQTSRTFPVNAFKAQETEQLRINGLTSRGLANLQLGDVDAAMTDLQEVEKLSPSSAPAKVNLAKVFVARRDLAVAAELYSKALKLDEKNFDALSGLVSVLNRSGNHETAKEKISAVIAKSKADKTLTAALHFLMSESLMSAKQTDAAENELKKSIAADEDYLPSYSAYASLLIGKNQTDQALAQYQKVVEKKPSASVYTLIGILEDGRGKFAEAEKNYRKALELNPGTPIAANNLAWLIADTGKGNLDEAMQLSRDVIKTNPKVSSYFDTLGWVYLKKGFKDQAVEQFKQAVAIDMSQAQQEGRVENAGYRLRLGMALHSAGQKDEAKREIAAALRTGTSQFSPSELQNAKRILGDS